MIKIYRLLLMIAILSFCPSVALSLHQPIQDANSPPPYAPNEIIVKFKESPISEDIDRLNAQYQVRKIKPLFKNFKKDRQRIKGLQQKNKTLLTKKENHILKRLARAPKGVPVPDLSRIYKIEVEPAAGQTLEEAVSAYNENAGVEYAELNYAVSVDREPNDFYYPIQWALNNTGQWYQESGKYNHQPGTADADIDARQAWDIHTGSSDIIVAVVDTGVDYRHRDLVNNMWGNSGEIPDNGIDDDLNGYVDDIYGYDFINVDNNPIDDNGHGSHCSGTIAAEGDNGLDVTGVCWNAKIMALKALDFRGSGWDSDAIAAFYYAVDNGADVVSNSWGGGSFMQSMQDAINYAYSQGVVMVASAGNYNSSSPNRYPANYDHVISVAATDSNDQKASFSNYGSWVDIAAPGVDILSLRSERDALGMIYDNYTTILSGTSMACPHVAGAAAMLLSIDSLMTVDELETILEDSADTIDPAICASGRLNLYQAIMDMADSRGIIRLDKNAYSCNDDIVIKLFDFDLAGDSTYTVVISTDGRDSETVILYELAAPGIFCGEIAATCDGWARGRPYDRPPVNPSESPPGRPAGRPRGLGDGILQVADGQVITVSYDDADDGTGNPATATDTADVDCQFPLISNVQIDATGPFVLVTFDTDEPATANIRAGTFCGDYIISAADPVLRTMHIVELRFLDPNTDYYFVIDAIDSAGNVTIDSNDSNCYSFTTVEALRVPGDYPTFQAAIDDANDGDTVLIADGTYTGSGNRDIEFKGKAITVKSENGPENCIIDCNGSIANPHRGFYFTNGECWRSVLDGLTITNGLTNRGGGIRCDDGSSPTITNCRITGNTATPDFALGGGLSLVEPGSSPTITNCIISNNTCTFQGGGIYIEILNSPIISNCTISNNAIIGDSANVGGGIHIANHGSLRLINCIINGNHSDSHGGGISIGSEDRYVGITNCTIINNSAADLAGGVYCGSAEPEIVNSILWGNTAASGSQIHIDWRLKISYSNIQNGLEGITSGGWAALEWGLGNIERYPIFAAPEVNDFHLLWSSPCINAGDPNYFGVQGETDIDGNPRVFYGRVDMGAYETIRQGEPQEADINRDGVVNLLDYAVLAWQWLDLPGMPSADITPILGDGIVDNNDLGFMADSWLWIEQAPAKAINPNPQNNANNVRTNIDLSWNSNSNPQSFNVYFGSSFNDVDTGTGDTFRVNQTELSYELETLDYQTDYYWRIDSKNAGGVTKGDIWHFRTSGSEPVGWWRFDDGAGDTAEDSAGDNDGTVTGATWTSGQIVGALDFDGDGDYVDVGNHESLNITPADGITLAVWIRPTTLVTYKRIISSPKSFGASGRYVLALPDSNGRIAVKFSGLADQKTTDVVLVPNTWTHISATCQESEQKIYVNGTEATIEDLGNTFYATKGTTLWIGGRQDNKSYFTGTLDDVRIYGRALSDQEIEQIYLEGLN